MRASAFVGALATLVANAQSTWVWQSGMQGQHSLVSDASHSPEGTAITIIRYSGPNGALPATSYLQSIDSFGNLQQTVDLPADWSNVQASFIEKSTSPGKLIVGGSANQGNLNGVFAMSLNAGFSTEWATLVLRDGLLYTQAMNGAVRTDGSTVIGGSGSVPPGVYSKAMLIAMSSTGEVISDTVYGASVNLAFVRQVAAWNDDLWITVDGAGLNEFAGSGATRAFRLNEDLTIPQWFTLAHLDQSPEPPFDTVPRGSLDFLPISASRFASSGHFGAISPPLRRAAVLVSDSLAAVHRLFLPRSEYPMDQPPFIQALSSTSEGNLWFAMHENAQLGPPSLFSVFEPNRIHVFKLDTSLNVLCEHLLDGFAENAYYYLNRIKATEDGGFLLLGGRRDLNDPSGYFAAWARKYGPDDCVVGITEKPPADAVIFPNPGREGFTLVLGGEAINGTLLVRDAMGRAVGRTLIRTGQARFDAFGLAAGVYVYRALDAQGALLAVGRWVKE